VESRWAYGRIAGAAGLRNESRAPLKETAIWADRNNGVAHR